MADIDITQAEADALIALEKHRVDEKQWTFPAAGERIAIPLTSSGKRENFVLDLDLDGPPHRNPDGQDIPCPHLHVYREGCGDKWAIAAPADLYPDITDLFLTCEAFMQHCKIIEPPGSLSVPGSVFT